MDDDIQRIVDGLAGPEDAPAVVDPARRRVSAGDTAFVACLGAVLHARFGSADVQRYRVAVYRLAHLLMFAPGQDALDHALRLLAVPRSYDDSSDRWAAEVLACARTPRELDAVFADGRGEDGEGGAEELRNCLVNELVLRGADLADLPTASRWAASAHRARHPLAWLPHALHSFEEEAEAISHSADGSAGCATSRSFFRTRSIEVPAAQLPAPRAVEVTTRPLTRALRTAVNTWEGEPNFRIEARVFEFAATLYPPYVPSVLASLDLACLEGLDPQEKWVKTCEPGELWARLFWISANAGTREEGAYGRLAAWRTLAALCGAPDGASADEVGERAEACHWFTFDAATDWFSQGVSGLAVATLTPDGRRLAVLAATAD
ncbi:DUF6183 family protein [Streptomyces sp. NPDC002685]|uniref:DUF6183 family protein n=1 Tax=Streptomyces sp. NPDC002685 TaxID=3154540 RepID=UPI0033215036